MNICYNTKHISKLSWLLNSFSPSHLRVNVDEGKGNSSVWRTVINLRQTCRVPLRLSCYGSQIRCVWVSTRPQEDPGIKVSWSLSLPQPSRTIRNTPRRKRAQVFHPQRRSADTYSSQSFRHKICVFCGNPFCWTSDGVLYWLAIIIGRLTAADAHHMVWNLIP